MAVGVVGGVVVGRGGGVGCGWCWCCCLRCWFSERSKHPSECCWCYCNIIIVAAVIEFRIVVVVVGDVGVITRLLLLLCCGDGFCLPKHPGQGFGFGTCPSPRPHLSNISTLSSNARKSASQAVCSRMHFALCATRPNTSRGFVLAASNACVVGESPTCSVPTL